MADNLERLFQQIDARQRRRAQAAHVSRPSLPSRRSTAPAQMSAVAAALATLASNPGALKWPPPPSEAGGGGMASSFARAASTAPYASQVFSAEALALLGKARTMQGDPAAWARSLPDGYGLERLAHERGIKFLGGLPRGEVWRLATGWEKANNLTLGLSSFVEKAVNPAQGKRNPYPPSSWK